MTTAVLGIGGFVAYVWWEGAHESIVIQNDTDRPIDVSVDSFSSLTIPPRMKRGYTLPEFQPAQTLYIYLARGDRVACDFERARQHEPVVIDDRGAHCD